MFAQLDYDHLNYDDLQVVPNLTDAGAAARHRCLIPSFAPCSSPCPSSGALQHICQYYVFACLQVLCEVDVLPLNYLVEFDYLGI